ncbi:MAG: hypothetical protein ACD_81C00193G0001 [uncultured bacterium]|nr:MAG: hypothetical protein ACD_81C00193G0001 [uncultured bacterium]
MIMDPRLKETEIITGRSSGVIPTAIATAKRNVVNIVCPRNI